jgi:hypothetical protein
MYMNNNRIIILLAGYITDVSTVFECATPQRIRHPYMGFYNILLTAVGFSPGGSG